MRIHISIMVEALGFYTHFPYQVFIFSPTHFYFINCVLKCKNIRMKG